MKTKKFITALKIKNGSFYKQNIASKLTGYGKKTGLIAIMLLSCQIGKSNSLDSNKITNTTMCILIADSANAATSNMADSSECANPATGKSVKGLSHSSHNTMADTLNFVAQQNEAIAGNMVNSYFQGIDDADSAYSIKKSSKAGIVLATIICTPILSFFPVAISSVISPSVKRLHADVSKFKNAAYRKGYRYQAHYIKKRQLWGSYVEGGTPWCIVMGFLTL